MLMEISKKELICLIDGLRPKTMQECITLTKLGVMKFTGNQWNESWEWNRDFLNSQTEEKLLEFYNHLKGVK